MYYSVCFGELSNYIVLYHPKERSILYSVTPIPYLMTLSQGLWLGNYGTLCHRHRHRHCHRHHPPMTLSGAIYLPPLSFTLPFARSLFLNVLYTATHVFLSSCTASIIYMSNFSFSQTLATELAKHSSTVPARPTRALIYKTERKGEVTQNCACSTPIL